MLFDLLSLSLWREFRIYSIMIGCISVGNENLYDRCLFAVAFVDGDWMLDVLWFHILTRE